MAIYTLRSANHACTGAADFNRQALSGTEGAGSIAVTIASTATEESYSQTVSKPNNDNAWETGTHTVEVNVTGASMNLMLSMRVERVNSSCVVQATGTATGEQALTGGIKTFTLTAPIWGTSACSDELRYVYIFRNTDTMMSLTVTIATGTTDTEHTSPITEDAGTCVGGAPRRVMVVS